MRYMLDTNICIFVIKRKPLEVVRRLQALSKGSAVMSVLTYAELRAGVEIQSTNRTHDLRVLAELVELIPALPFTSPAADAFGVLRSLVRERNRDTIDRLIAAHAFSLGLTLVTNNERDFTPYLGLVVENWIAAGAAT